ncbi:hypothetical protein ACW9IB_19865 [Pseudomonas sp. SDO524_S393]
MRLNAPSVIPGLLPEHNWLYAPTAPEQRPSGDTRTARQIIDTSPALKHLLRRPHSYIITDALKRQLGDWTATHLGRKRRADTVYSLARVVNFIDNLNDRKVGNSERGDNKINGFHNAGYATRKNSEARLLVEFAEKGYDALQNLGH